MGIVHFLVAFLREKDRDFTTASSEGNDILFFLFFSGSQ
jgi:hypothetical protein